MTTKAAPASAKWKPVIRVVAYLCVSGLMPLSTALSAPNFLVIMGDDMGVETLSCYGLNDDTAVTPTLDNLCDHGIRFDNMWSQPVCSPTRATILTGRLRVPDGYRTPDRNAARRAEGRAGEAPGGASRRRPQPAESAGITAGTFPGRIHVADGAQDRSGAGV